MADSTLQAIRVKVRRLTRTPSANQLSDADLDQYINTFVLYDIPEHLRLFALRDTFTFYTNPFQDVYPTDNTILPVINPLFDFKNKYITVHEPIYIAGFRVYFSQNRDQFFNWYPFINAQQQIGTGNGIITTFTGTIPSAPLLQNNVLISSINTTFDGLSLVDVPIVDPATGIRTTQGNLYVAGQEPATPPIAVLANNNIDYRTGAFTATFSSAPGVGQAINSQSVPVQPTRPQALLYFNNEFTVRPVPDQPYAINMEVYRRPTELLAVGQEPELQQWWQYIAYGAAKKVFEDRQDLESVSLIMPEFKQQERLVLRRTIVQQTAERVATIYTESNGVNPYGPNWFNGY